MHTFSVSWRCEAAQQTQSNQDFEAQLHVTHLADVVRWVLWVVAVNATLQSTTDGPWRSMRGVCVLASMTSQTKTSAALLGCTTGAPPDHSTPSCMSVPTKSQCDWLLQTCAGYIEETQKTREQSPCTRLCTPALSARCSPQSWRHGHRSWGCPQRRRCASVRDWLPCAPTALPAHPAALGASLLQCRMLACWACLQGVAIDDSGHLQQAAGCD